MLQTLQPCESFDAPYFDRKRPNSNAHDDANLSTWLERHVSIAPDLPFVAVSRRDLSNLMPAFMKTIGLCPHLSLVRNIYRKAVQTKKSFV